MTDTTTVPDVPGGCATRVGRADPRAGARRQRGGRHRLPGRRAFGRRACPQAGHGAADAVGGDRPARRPRGRMGGWMGGRAGAARRRSCAAADRLAQERAAALRALRPARSPASVVAALALVGAGAVALVEAFTVVAGRAPRLVAFERAAPLAEPTAWRDPAALGTAGAVTVLGLLLVLAGVLPGRPRLVPLRTGDPGLVLGVSRPVLAALVAGEVSRVTGVRGVRVRVRRRRLVVAAAVGPRASDALGDRVREAAERELARLNPLVTLTVRCRIRVAAGGERHAADTP